MSATQQTPNLGLPKLKGSDTTSWLGDFNGAMEILDRIINVIYPVGSYYETNDANFNPNTAWKGTTWVEDTSGTVLVSRTEAGTFTSVGSTGGRETTNHVYYRAPINSQNSQNANDAYNVYVNARVNTWLTAGGSSTVTLDNIVASVAGSINGDGNIRNPTEASFFKYTSTNLQPYTVVKRWRRTA